MTIKMKSDEAYGWKSSSHSDRSFRSDTDIAEKAPEFFSILDSVPHAVICVHSRLIIFANREVPAIFGWMSEDLIGSDVGVLYQGNMNLFDPYEGDPSAVHRQEPVTAEIVCNHKNGHEILCEVSIASAQDSVLEGMVIVSHKDISKLKQLQEDFRLTEEKYRKHIDAVSDVICSLDEDLRIISISSSVERIIGYSPEELIGKRYHETGILCEDHLEKGFANVSRVFSGESTNASLYELVAKDSTRRFAEISSSPIIRNGMVIQALCVARDVTERIIAQEALQESEKKYREFFENVSDFLYVHDLEGNFIETNIASKIVTGYSEEDLSATNIMDFVPPKYKPFFPDYLQRVRKNGKDEGFVRLIANDGSEHIIEYRNSLIHDGNGNPVAVRGSARDITEYMQDKKALKESEEKYRTILENLEDGYYEVDLKGNFTFFNDSMCAILGYSPDELMGVNNREFMDRNNAKKVFETFSQVYRSGQSTKAFDWEVIRKDGAVQILETSVTLIRDSAGNSTGFRGIARDLTELRQAERQRSSLEKRLHQAQKMEVIGTLAGGVAHDLNNILSALVSYPELILMDLDQDNPMRKPIITIKQSGEKAAAIVQDLLTLARRGVSTTKVISINSVILDYLKSPEYEKLILKQENIEINIDCDDDLLCVVGSPFHLSKVIMNLVINAAEAMPEGGSILISARNTCLNEPIKGYDQVKPGKYVVLKVSDTGAGISADNRDKIFEPFYTRKIMGRSGTGLGMTVVWGTVQDHNGYIDVCSEQGKGTTFSIYLPATSSRVADGPSPSIYDYMGNGEKIIIVDDAEIQRDIASRILNRLGYKVIAFSSGEDVVEYMKSNSADLIILDMIMDPGMDGLDTYRRILVDHPGQKAIIASGYSETERVKEVQKLGAGTYIKKPYLLETIAQAVKEELSKLQ
ncbi:MAG: PAS domain S-box protein [Deltaproteobacteria bacterium]|nr:PAS domain S-box protein [Deltaproteobacteria bacterium]